MKKKGSILALNNWLKGLQGGANIQLKLTEIETRSKRLKVIGWHVFSQALMDYIKNSVLSAVSNTRFLHPLLMLKFQLEIAVGMRNNEKARELIKEMENHLIQEMIQAKKSGLFSHEEVLKRLKKQIISVHQAISPSERLFSSLFATPSIESKRIQRKSKHHPGIEMKRLIPVIPERKIEFKEEDEKETVEEKKGQVVPLQSPSLTSQPTTLADSLLSSIDTEIENEERKDWELDAPLLSGAATSSDAEFKGQKSKDSKHSPSHSNKMENFRYDFFIIENGRLLNGSEKIIREIGNKILDLDNRAKGCCVASQHSENCKSKAG